MCIYIYMYVYRYIYVYVLCVASHFAFFPKKLVGHEDFVEYVRSHRCSIGMIDVKY